MKCNFNFIRILVTLWLFFGDDSDVIIINAKVNFLLSSQKRASLCCIIMEFKMKCAKNSKWGQTFFEVESEFLFIKLQFFKRSIEFWNYLKEENLIVNLNTPSEWFLTVLWIAEIFGQNKNVEKVPRCFLVASLCCILKKNESIAKMKSTMVKSKMVNI